MSDELQQPLSQEHQDQPYIQYQGQQQQQYVPQQNQQQQQQQHMPQQNQQYNQSNYEQQQQQHHDRPTYSSEFRQSQNQPADEEQFPSHNDGISQIANIDQWVRIAPCALLGVAMIIIGSIFLGNCDLTQVSVYITSGSVLLIVPLVVYFYDIQSKFMNFIASLISFYFMIVLSVYANEQRLGMQNDDAFYQQYCLSKDQTEPYKGISYGVINLLGLTMCLLHTVNTVYYFAQVWMQSKHTLKEKVENYTIEFI